MFKESKGISVRLQDGLSEHIWSFCVLLAFCIQPEQGRLQIPLCQVQRTSGILLRRPCLHQMKRDLGSLSTSDRFDYIMTGSQIVMDNRKRSLPDVGKLNWKRGSMKAIQWSAPSRTVSNSVRGILSHFHVHNPFSAVIVWILPVWPLRPSFGCLYWGIC